jgi:pimeloyl-ACP methyl ester carboxylesterase/predicted ester cyclase
MPILDHAGLRLAYDDTAAPNRPGLVLLHGWCSHRADLAPLAREFQDSYRVVNLDLAGHGGSGTPPDGDRLAIGALAGDVIALADELGLREAVLVGHSAGAAVAVEVAATRPDLVAGVVALEGTLLFPAATLDQAAPLLAALDTPGWLDAIQGYLAATFLPTDDPGVVRRAQEHVATLAQHVVAGVPRQLLAWDGEAALAAVGEAGMPMLYVEATGGLSDLERVGELVPQLQLGQVVGVGHDQMLATPEQAAALVRGFLAAALGQPRVDNLRPVLELFGAISAGDLDAIDTLVAPDFVDHAAPPPLGRGPEGYKQVFRMLRGALDMSWELLDLMADGERVMARGRVRGRHVGEFVGIPPTGRTFTMDAMHLYRVVDGVIREHWAVRDDLGLFRQLGVVAA